MLQHLALKDLRRIPGVGKAVSLDLYRLGYRSVNALKNQNPEKMYEKLCKIQGRPIDRCMLYVMRCAVYFASRKKHRKELLLWWNWKDKRL